MDDNIYIMWLTLIDGLGIKKQHQLLESFGDAKKIFNTSRQILRTISFLNEKIVNNIIKSQDTGLIKKYISQLEESDTKFMSIRDKEYPSMLKEISNPPVGIYLKGCLPDNSLPKVSIIGARRSSEYGLNVSYKLSKDLAKRGIVIVSGLASGIDSMSHKGALDANGYTIAVLGFGTSECYPVENKNLMQKISRNGCLISEYPPYTKALPAYFPARNRIISGLSSATIVVEASEKSGTLITVNEALAEGRTVMAVPGNITSKLSAGTNELIRDGAAPVSSYKDVLYELGIDNSNINLLKHKDTAENISKTFSKEEQLIYDYLSFEPITVDQLILETKSTIQTLNYLLTMLELKGHIQKLPGQRYIRAL